MMRIIIIIMITITMMVILSPPTYMPLNLPLPSHCKTKKKNRNSVACPVGRLDLPPHFADHQFPHWWWPSESPMPCVECSRVLNSQGRCHNNMGSEGECKSPLKSVEKCTRVKFHTMQRIKSLFQTMEHHTAAAKCVIENMSWTIRILAPSENALLV